MKVDYAIELLRIDLNHEIQSIWQLRHKVHPAMIESIDLSISFSKTTQ